MTLVFDKQPLAARVVHNRYPWAAVWLEQLGDKLYGLGCDPLALIFDLEILAAQVVGPLL